MVVWSLALNPTTAFKSASILHLACIPTRIQFISWATGGMLCYDDGFPQPLCASPWSNINTTVALWPPSPTTSVERDIKLFSTCMHVCELAMDWVYEYGIILATLFLTSSTILHLTEYISNIFQSHHDVIKKTKSLLERCCATWQWMREIKETHHSNLALA